MRPSTLLAILTTSVLLGSAIPTQAAPIVDACVPGRPTTMEMDVGTVELTTVCTVEELLEFLGSIDCTPAPTDLAGDCIFCPPVGGTESAPAGRMDGNKGVFVAYFPAGLGSGGIRGYHVVFIPIQESACGVET